MGTVISKNNRSIKDEEGVICYIIITHFGTYYTGITNNLIRRWNEHKDKMSSYLSQYLAKEVVHWEMFKTRKEAAQKERLIKKVGAKKYLLKLKFRA